MRILVTVYTLLLRLYPRQHREQFAEEMRLVFQMSLEDAKDGQAVVRLCLRELRDFPLSLLNEHMRGRNMPFRYKLLAVTFVVTIIVAAVASLGIWGYLFAPPPVEPLTTQFQTVTAMSAFRVAPDYTFTPDRLTAVPAIDDRFIPLDRIFEALNDRLPLLDPNYQNTALLDRLEDKFRAEAIELGCYYVDSLEKTPPTHLFAVGYMLEGIDSDGNSLVLVNFSSTQITNDDYTYYEWLFREGEDGLTEIGRNHFNYHIAGIEGFTFPMMVMIFMFPALLIYLLNLLIVDVSQRFIKRSQLRPN